MKALTQKYNNVNAASCFRAIYTDQVFGKCEVSTIMIQDTKKSFLLKSLVDSKTKKPLF